MPNSGGQTHDAPGTSSNYREFVSSIEVVYGDCPGDYVKEIYGGSAQINEGQGPTKTWLRVHRLEHPGPMINGFSIAIGSIQEGRPDLAWGCGGKYRYVDWDTRPVDNPVIEVGLWRSDDSQDFAPNGWHGKSDDINRSRGGDYLYLVWKCKRYTGPR